MKKQKNKNHTTFWKSVLPVLFASFIVTGLSAQKAVTQRVTEVDIPNNVTSLYLELKGGDGGDAYTGSCKAQGGAGALTKAVFFIGDGYNMIPTGARLRFIRGENGGSEDFTLALTGTGDAGGAGGGGSAVLYRKAGSTSEDDWKILAVAGGGGGAYSGMFASLCTDVDDGKGGSATTSGGSGHVQSDKDEPGGTDGGQGFSYNQIAAGGGGGALHSAAAPMDKDGAGGQQGMPKGGSGGHCPGCESGGFGFGGGGYSFYAGGGGGGYSGGSAGSIGEGGGGGSYVHPMTNAYKIVAGEKGGGQKALGYVKYKFDPDNNLTLNLLSKGMQLTSSAKPKCVTNAGGKSDNGNNIQLFDCITGRTSQNWIFDNFQIRATSYPEKCMDVQNHNTANGTNVRIWDCMEHDEQRWIYDGITKQLRSFLNIKKCLNVEGNGATANGTNIHLWSCNNDGGKADQWDITNGTTVSNPTNIKYIVPVINSSYLAFQSYSGAKMSSNIRLGPRQDNDNSIRWVFDGLQIKYGPSRDLCIGLANNSTADHTNVQLMGSASNDNTRKWIYNGNTKQIHSVADPDKCLALQADGGAFRSQVNLYLADCELKLKQQFYIVDK